MYREAINFCILISYPEKLILTWRIAWTEEPGGLQSVGLQRVRHDWATNTKNSQLTKNIMTVSGSIYSVISSVNSELFSILLKKNFFLNCLIVVTRTFNYICNSITYMNKSSQIGLVCLVPDLSENTLLFIIKYDVKYGFVINDLYYVEIVVVQSLSHVWLFVTTWTASTSGFLSFTVSQSLLKFMPIESVMPSKVH